MMPLPLSCHYISLLICRLAADIDATPMTAATPLLPAMPPLI